MKHPTSLLLRGARWAAFLGLLALAQGAHAHADAANLAGGFASGFVHPILGWDHVVAMVAVGLWGAFMGERAVWTLPVVFPAVMALGGVLGLMGVPVPLVEEGIAASAIVIGAMVALGSRRGPAWALARSCVSCAWWSSSCWLPPGSSVRQCIGDRAFNCASTSPLSAARSSIVPGQGDA